jgi:WD40 repeat protein
VNIPFITSFVAVIFFASRVFACTEETLSPKIRILQLSSLPDKLVPFAGGFVYNPLVAYILSTRYRKKLKKKRYQLLKGHNQKIVSVAITPDGSVVATGAPDNTARIWHVKTASCTRIIREPIEYIYSIALSANAQRLLTGSYFNHCAHVWDIPTGKREHCLKGHTWRIRSVTMSADGSHGITGSEDCSARWWNLDTGKCLGKFPGPMWIVSTVTMTPDGKFALIAGWEKRIFVWNLTQGTRIKTLQYHVGDLCSVAISGNGRYCLVGADDDTALWDLATEKRVTIKCSYEDSFHVALTENGDYGLLGPCLWDLVNHKKLLMLTDTIKNKSCANAITPNASYAVLGYEDSNARVWKLTMPRCLRNELRQITITQALFLNEVIAKALRARPGFIRILHLYHYAANREENDYYAAYETLPPITRSLIAPNIRLHDECGPEQSRWQKLKEWHAKIRDHL